MNQVKGGGEGKVTKSKAGMEYLKEYFIKGGTRNA
jgi:hypothetical protein